MKDIEDKEQSELRTLNEIKISKQQNSKRSKEEQIYEGNVFKNAFKKSKEFLKNKVKDIKRNAKKIWKSIKQTTGSSKSRNTFKPGTLVAFQYNAKHSQNRYDKSPLVIMLGPSRTTKNLFLGLNLHHLPLSDRVRVGTFFMELLKKRQGKLEYNDIKVFTNKFKGHPVLRSYYYSRVSSKVYEMTDEQYLTACALPSENIIN